MVYQKTATASMEIHIMMVIPVGTQATKIVSTTRTYNHKLTVIGNE